MDLTNTVNPLTATLGTCHAAELWPSRPDLRCPTYKTQVSPEAIRSSLDDYLQDMWVGIVPDTDAPTLPCLTDAGVQQAREARRDRLRADIIEILRSKIRWDVRTKTDSTATVTVSADELTPEEQVMLTGYVTEYGGPDGLDGYIDLKSAID